MRSDQPDGLAEGGGGGPGGFLFSHRDAANIKCLVFTAYGICGESQIF